MPATPTPIITAGRRMGTGTSRRGFGHAGVLGLALVALVLAACGTSHAGVSKAGRGHGGASQAGATQAGTFSWLHPQAPPAGWRVARIPTGAELAYPPSWRLQHGDPGTATAALLGSRGRVLGYLNLTPRQGAETLAGWTSFRIHHNGEEGDRAIQRLAAATGLHFLGGRGSCVKDAYSTITHSRYIEIACLVSGARTESVIVGAAPPTAWAAEAGAIERAIEGVAT